MTSGTPSRLRIRLSGRMRRGSRRAFPGNTFLLPPACPPVLHREWCPAIAQVLCCACCEVERCATVRASVDHPDMERDAVASKRDRCQAWQCAVSYPTGSCGEVHWSPSVILAGQLVSIQAGAVPRTGHNRPRSGCVRFWWWIREHQQCRCDQEHPRDLASATHLMFSRSRMRRAAAAQYACHAERSTSGSGHGCVRSPVPVVAGSVTMRVSHHEHRPERFGKTVASQVSQWVSVGVVTMVGLVRGCRLVGVG